MRNDEQKYVSERMSSRRDDRSDRNKWMRDAELRGKIGTRRANQIIGAIDNIKMHR